MPGHPAEGPTLSCPWEGGCCEYGEQPTGGITAHLLAL